MDLHELRVAARLIDGLAKRALFAEKQMVALEGQCAEWKRIADALKAERNLTTATAESVIKERDGWIWAFEHCTPCDPPTASHDTPEGRSVAESVIRNDRNTEPKPGDVVRLVRKPTQEDYPSAPWADLWGQVGQTDTVINVFPDAVIVSSLRSWPISCIEIVEDAK